MASQLKSSFTSPVSRSLLTPKGISGSPFRVVPSKRSPRFTVKAVQADKGLLIEICSLHMILCNRWFCIKRGVEIMAKRRFQVYSMCHVIQWFESSKTSHLKKSEPNDKSSTFTTSDVVSR